MIIRPRNDQHKKLSPAIGVQAVSLPLTAEAGVRGLGQSMWDFWWAKWHWDTFFFPVNISPP